MGVPLQVGRRDGFLGAQAPLNATSAGVGGESTLVCEHVHTLPASKQGI
jgi:hypothetical protein